MKKFFVFLFLFIFTINVKAEKLEISAPSAILIENSTGEVLYEKNSHEKLAPASMTKIMSLLLIMENIDNNKISLTDQVNISASASSMGGSQIFLDENSTVTVEELLKGITIASANDAVVAMAEYIAGSESEFVNLMNEKATSLGLVDTHFSNSHGLDTENHYSSAYDMAIMARELIKHEKILSYTSIYEDYFTKPNGSKIWLVNTNKLVKFYPGVDGLKTGYTKNAGYCLTSTAKKNDIRFITVLMNEPSSEIRSKDTTTLLNYGFNSYKLTNIVKKGKKVDVLEMNKASKEKVNVYLENDLNVIKKNNEEIGKYKLNFSYDKMKLPLKSGDVVGKLEVIDEKNEIILTGNLIVKDNINELSLGKLYIKTIKKLFVGI